MAKILGEKNGVRQANYDVDTKIVGGATRKTWNTTYLVLGSNSEDEDDIAIAPGMPILYEVYRNGFCIGKDVQELTKVQGGYLWEVTCNFDSHIDSDIPVVDISWDVEEKDMVQKFDAITGIPILNSAREPIILTSPVSFPVLTMKRVEASFDGSRTLLYNNKLNYYTFMGAPPFCAWMKGPTARKRLVKGIRKWDVTYRIKFNMMINPATMQPMGWKMFLLDHGTRFWEESLSAGEEGGGWVNFKTDQEKDDTTGNLDGKGGPLPKGAPEVYLQYNRFALINFNSLGLV